MEGRIVHGRMNIEYPMNLTPQAYPLGDDFNNSTAVRPKIKELTFLQSCLKETIGISIHMQ